MKITIPSHNRPNIITFGILREFDFDEEVFVFVNDEKQAQLYTTFWDELLADNKIQQKPNLIITNTKGIQKARNYILDYFPKDEKILMLDDDIEGVYELKSETRADGKIKKSLKPLPQIREFIKYAFTITEKNNTKLWGIYPVYNPFYMDKKINNKGFVIGSFMGIINSDIRFDNNLPLKEDYQFTADHLIKYKKIARFDYITAKIKHYSNSGGCVELRKEKKELEKKCCEYLIGKYPFLFRFNPKRDNEVLFCI